MHAELQQIESRDTPQPPNSVLFPNAYTWLVLAASLDIIMTHLMLSLGAIEVNIVANHALETAGLWGLIALKFSVIASVLWICEYVGRRQLSTARSLVGAGVALNFLPVVFSFVQLIVFFDDWVGVFMHS
ncbi:hypothetical protein MNBD_PLANCTO03-2457 [hydrothermal vent metagenome]|uniref:DUF5658 domain-containing protein n=1 Tax=hydrothermal vent metagenome TaxID=652676 RepID=A0A3B1D7V1_9ZZZZ